MAVEQLRDRGPRYLPPGYRLSHTTPGSAVRKLGDGAEQLTFTFLRTFAANEVPLRVTIAEGSGRILRATEHRPCVSVAVGERHAVGRYHDGSWAPGGGDHQVDLADGYIIHWDRSRFHSVTVSTGTETAAVLAPKELSIDEIVKVAGSIPGLLPGQ